jgi:putative Mg2+ transporter-C (MgtC) family protein
MFTNAWEITLNLGSALAAGGLIGMERSYNGRAAGFRTNALVGLAAAAAMTITMEPSVLPNMIAGAGPRLDPTRIGQGVMAGIGFLGAGVIFKEGVSVQGLTTAACIWTVAAIGMLFGLGMFYAGAATTLAAMAILIAFRGLETLVTGHVYALAVLRFRAEAAPTEAALKQMMDEHEVVLRDVSYGLRQGGEIIEYSGNLRTRSPNGLQTLAVRLRGLDGLVEYDLERISK